MEDDSFLEVRKESLEAASDQLTFYKEVLKTYNTPVMDDWDSGCRAGINWIAKHAYGDGWKELFEKRLINLEGVVARLKQSGN